MSLAQVRRGVRAASRRRTTGPAPGTVLATQAFTGTNGAAWPAEFSAAGTGTNTIQSNAGRITTGSGAAYTGRRILWTPAGVVDNLDSDLLTTLTTPTSGESFLSLGLRVTSTTPLTGNNAAPQNGYTLVVTVNPSTGQVASLELNRFIANARTVLVAATAVTPGAGPYKARFKIVGNRLQGRIWASASAEPTTWPIDFTDSSPYSTPGRPYLSAINGADAVDRTFAVDDLTWTAG